MTDQMLPLGEGRDRRGHEGIAWSRTGLDSYEKFHRDAFLPLVPAAGHLTVDIGCGEGRVSRDLRTLVHRGLAIDLSLTMGRAAATHPAAPVPAVVAAPARLPPATLTADCAVALLALLDAGPL